MGASNYTVGYIVSSTSTFICLGCTRKINQTHKFCLLWTLGVALCVYNDDQNELGVVKQTSRPTELPLPTLIIVLNQPHL